jgi:hypothetical protein
MTLLDRINDKVKNAPPAIVQEVLDFIEFLEAKAPAHRFGQAD